jgi:diacylglycerol O-acyltransferase / wax synthase
MNTVQCSFVKALDYISTSKDSSMMSKDFIPSSSYTVSAVLVTTVVVAWFYSKKPKQRSDNVTRRWSYTSAGMAIGAFPAKANTPDPIINAVMFFQECPRTQEIVNQIVTKMLQYERLNSVYDTITGKSRLCENLDPQDLVRVIKVQGSDQDSLMAIVDQQMHYPLSEGSRGELLPWWEFLVLQNTGRGPSAVVWRSHHALADGISMVNIVEDIITDMDGNPVVNILPRSMEKKFKIQRSFFDIALGIFKGVGSFLYMMSGPFDDKTAFHQAGVDMVHSQKRRAVCFQPVPLHFIKDLKHAAGVSLNDIIYTCLSQAIHDYLEEEDDVVLKVKGKSLLCRALMPMAFPGREGSDKATLLRNRWCFLSADFGVGIDQIMDRLSFVHTSMTKLKQSMLPMVVIASQNYIAPLLPMSLNRGQVLDLFSRHSTVFSNVPGPASACKFAGYEVMGVQMVFSNLIPQVGVLSYRGQVFGNITLDSDATPHSERIPILYSRAFVALGTHLNVDVPYSIRSHAEGN